jgi:hypothetical protein
MGCLQSSRSGVGGVCVAQCGQADVPAPSALVGCADHAGATVGGHRAVGLRHVNPPIGDRVGAIGEFDQAPLAKLGQDDGLAELLNVVMPARRLPARPGSGESTVKRQRKR